ncbi:hypothetical protein ID866_3921 [Astraeus odoratus]|nr:hypothetical protein ID866_3921 [Astraeus odoratus]
MASLRRTSSIPYAPSEPYWTSVNPRPLLPIQPYPHPLPCPRLPTPPRQHAFHGPYTLSTHIIPAAFPRCVPDVPLPEVPPHSASTSALKRQEQIEIIGKEIVERQQCFVQGKLPGGHSQKPLWNAINRYIRAHSGNTTGPRLTLFLAHANGFPKETWEVMLRHLFDSPAAHLVDEVWSWEAVQHGDSALLNAQNLSGIFEWQDNTRDIANFLLNYLPDEVSAAPLPTQLARIPQATSDARRKDGYRKRKLVVVGHSFGGATSFRAALDFPKLFSSLILVDPVIAESGPSGFTLDHSLKYVVGALIRRSTWPSRNEALRLFKQSPFFASWHPEVLKLYVDYGLTTEPHGGVRLKMSPVQEGLGFANRQLAYEAWELLEKLDDNIALRWVIPNINFSGEKLHSKKVWRRPANASNVVFPFAGHLLAQIVQEAPVELALDISTFLLREYGSWAKAVL